MSWASFGILLAVAADLPKLAPVSVAESQAILEIAHAGATFSIFTLHRNLMCKFGDATDCANGTETMRSADDKLNGIQLRNDGAKLLQTSACHAMLFVIAESWEIDWQVAALLLQLKKAKLGPDRLLVMHQHDELRDAHKVNIEIVRSCSDKSVGGSFGVTMESLAKRFHIPDSEP